MWKAKPSNRFKSSYKKLSNDMVERADKAIETLLTSERPEQIGISKTARRKGYFSYELGRQCRIIYKPEYEEMEIDFFRLCSHKQAYDP